jgi:adenylate cyclase
VTPVRRLAAILSADVAGYSRLMGDDEEATLRTLTDYRGIMRDRIEAHAGRVVDAPGDALLAEFASPVEAVAAAAEIQQRLKARNAQLADHRRMEIRIGINLGDVLHEDGALYGDGVNVAARLESLAEPGGVWVSAAARDQVGERLDVGFEDTGEHEVKNIARPVHAFRVLPDGSAPAADAALALPDKPSIAVLPFDNMSGDPEQEYFSDGIAEDIITALSKLGDLFVIARNSTFTYKGKAVIVQDVCRDLGVATILEGSVRKAGNRVRITAQLIDGATGGHLWAERYDRDLDDVFAVQDEVTAEIVAALKVKLTVGERETLTKRESVNMEAYDLILRGREKFMEFSKEASEEAEALYQRALTLDPDYPPVYARLGQIHMGLARLGWGDDPEAEDRKALEYANKAIELDETLPFAHGVLAGIYLWRGRHDEAIAEGERWVELDPNEADALLNLAGSLVFAGRPEDALPLIEKSMRLNPRYSFLTLFALGHAHFLMRRYGDAAATFERGLKRNPNFFPLGIFLASAYGYLAEADKARAVFEGYKSQLGLLLNATPVGASYKRPEDNAHLMEGLRKAGMDLPDAAS